jgi:hypothetical protein
LAQGFFRGGRFGSSNDWQAQQQRCFFSWTVQWEWFAHLASRCLFDLGTRGRPLPGGVLASRSIELALRLSCASICCEATAREMTLNNAAVEIALVHDHSNNTRLSRATGCCNSRPGLEDHFFS